MQCIPVWDIFVRVTHWAVASLVLAELVILDEDGPRYARFSAFPPSLQSARAHLAGLLRSKYELHLSHNPQGALMAYNLWASLIAVCVTGTLMTTRTFWGVDWVEDSHEIIANWVLVSVSLHVAGVMFETWRSKVNLVRAMITGQKEIPGPGE
jgi:cytochrome b